MTEELTEYATFESGYPLLTSSRSGLMFQDEFRDKASTENRKTLFSVVPYGKCTYRHMSDDDIFHFNINTITENGLVSREYPVFDASEDSNLSFIVQFLNSSPEFTRFCGQRKLGGTRTRLYYKNLCDFKFYAPSKEEQDKIAAFFDELDTTLALHQRKCDELSGIKKILLKKMFPQEGKYYPEIRFKGFTEAWEQRKLGDEMTVTSVKRILQSDWTSEGVRFLRARDIVSASKNEEPTDYLYISKDKYDEYSALSGKVSIGDMLVTGVGTIGIPYLISNSEPIYFKDGNIIWFQNENKIDGKFFFYSFCGQSIQQYIKGSAGIGTVGTYTIESGKKTPISLPNKDEQKAIGTFFYNLDDLITLHQRKVEYLQNMKKDLLKKMFV